MGKLIDNNIITSPSNCLPPKQLINGICRDVWRQGQEADRHNVITVPPNCKEGQELVNGECRDIWYQIPAPRATGNQPSVITVPPNCKDGQILINGVCRDVWRISAPAPRAVQLAASLADEDDVNVLIKNIIDVPNQCPKGYRPDANGVCRPIL
ncbi:uncharacterized protein LOC125062104 isoform X2 [Pieris napi]|uniref:uncharacterized protein LOC125062104 isoform X2 n=1 Tax=Pieris napi TaxID=78633 RepID=UPI001FB96951|nr:uncharacterized protein LOC125062104 isoform X2 [Pieris napi]